MGIKSNLSSDLSNSFSVLINKFYSKYVIWDINPLTPEFTIVIFIHYKPRIAIAILDL